ncbi:MAG: tape measure protein [Pseudorhodoferax sp.]
MASDERKAQLAFEVDGSGVKPGLDKIKRDVAGMAGDVEKAGKKAAAGVAGIASGADAASKKLEGNARTWIRTVERVGAAFEAGEKGTARYYEALGARRGLSADFMKPYLDDLRQVEVRQKSAASSVSFMTGAMNQLKAAAAGYVSLQTARAFVQTADSVTELNSRLRLATGSAAAAQLAYGSLYEIAQRSRVGFIELGQTYASIARATGELGVSQQRMLTVTESIGNAMTISGGSAQGMQAALVQLSQGMASGTLRGEELNSVLEQAPRLAKAIADGMGVTIGQLRELGSTGQLTSEAVIRALESQSAVLSKEVAGATLTVSQAFTQLSNSSVNAVGEFDKASGASATLAKGLSATASAMDALGRTLKENEKPIAAVMGALTGAAALASLSAVPRAIAAVGGAVSALGVVLSANPVVLALLGVGAVVGGAVAYSDRFKKTEEGIRQTIASLEALNKQGPSIYARDAESMRQWDETVAKRKKDIAALQQQLAVLANAGLDTRAEDARFAAQTERMRAQERAADELTKIKQKLMGVDESYLPTLNKLYAAYQSGAIKIEEYRMLVGKLAEANYKADKGAGAAAKDAVDARLEAIKAGLQAEASLTKTSLEDLASLRRMQQISERDYIDQTANIDVANLQKRMAALQAEMAIQATQTDSLKEVAALKGQMAAVDQEITERRKQQLREVTEMTYKLRDASLSAAAAQRQQAEDELAAYRRELSAEQNRALQGVNDYVKGIDEANKLLALEVSLLGQGSRIRSVAVQQYQAQLRLKQEIAKLDKLEPELQTRKKAEAEAAYLRELAGIQQRALLDEWDRTVQQVEDSLTDALMRGFQSGESFAENFKKTLEAAFQTMILKPIIQATLQQATGGIGSVIGSVIGGGNTSGGNGVLGLANNASSLVSLYNNAGSYLSKIGGLFGLGGGAAAATTVQTGAQLGAAFEAYMAAQGTAATAGGTAAGAAASGMSAIPIIGWILAGIAASNTMYGKGYSIKGFDTGTAIATGNLEAKVNNKILGAFMGDKWADILSGGPLIDKALDFLGISGGEKRFGGHYGVNYEGDQVYDYRRGGYIDSTKGQVTFVVGPSGGEFAQDAVKETIDTTVKGINGILGALESNLTVTAFQAGLETSANGRGGVFAGGYLTGGISFGETGIGGSRPWESTSSNSPNAEEALKNFSLDMQQATIQALQKATDIPKSIQEYLKQFDAESMTTEQIQEVLTAIGERAAVIGQFRDALKALPFENLRALSFDTAEALIAAAGGLDVLNANLTGYFQNFYSEEEQRQAAINATSKAFEDLGLTMPSLEQSSDAARAQFRAMVDSIDVSTEKGREQYVGVLALQGAFADLTPIIDTTAAAAQAAAAALQERQTLEMQLLQLQGDTAEIRKRELVALLTDENRAIKEAIYALQDKQAADAAAETAAAAAERVKAAWQSVGDTLVDEVKRIRGEIAGTDGQGYDFAMSQFAIATGQARAGDQDAAASLPELSRTVLELAAQNAASAADLKVIQGQVAASLLETTKQLGASFGITVPSLSVGTTFVPQDALVQLHKGEAVIPAAFNPFSAGGFTPDTRTPELLAQLVEENRVQAGEIARLNLRVAKLLEKWDVDGMPAEREEA